MKTRNLPCRLTDPEVISRATRITDLHRDIAVEEESLKARAEHSKNEVKRLKTLLNDVLFEVRTRSEYRDVEVLEEKVIEDGTWCMRTSRLDTGEIVDTRPITYNELQEKLITTGEGSESESADNAAAKEAAQAAAGAGSATIGEHLANKVAGETEPVPAGKKGKRKKKADENQAEAAE